MFNQWRKPQWTCLPFFSQGMHFRQLCDALSFAFLFHLLRNAWSQGHKSGSGISTWSYADSRRLTKPWSLRAFCNSCASTATLFFRTWLLSFLEEPQFVPGSPSSRISCLPPARGVPLAQRVCSHAYVCASPVDHLRYGARSRSYLSSLWFYPHDWSNKRALVAASPVYCQGIAL